MDLAGRLAAGRHEVTRRDAQVLDEGFKLPIDELLEPVVDICILEAVLLSVLKDDTILIDEVDNRVLPGRRRQVVRHDVQNPVL